MEKLLEFKNVSFQYPQEDFAIIDDLSFSLNKGEFVSIIGASGCGKSTIFRLVNGLLDPKAGEITVGGKSIVKQKNYCGYMPQKDMLFPWRSVLENVMLPMEISKGGKSQEEMKTLAREALKTAGLEGWEDKAPSELSGGMRQRAAFVRTLMTGCELLLLDEPFSALDYLTRISMREWLLAQWEKEQKTVLFITHDVEEAIFLSGRILIAEESPIKSLKSVEVPLGYPRTAADLASPEIARLKESLIDIFRRQMK